MSNDKITFVNESVSLKQNKSEILQNLQQIIPKLLIKQYAPNTKYSISINSEFGLYGYTNLLFLVKPIGFTKEYLLRIYGESVVDRKRELKYLLELQNFNVGPRVYGVFQNGRIEQFYSDAIVVDPFKTYNKINKIAIALADFHKVIITQNKQSLITDQEGIWSMLEIWYDKAANFKKKDFNDNNKYKKWGKLNWKNIENQINWMKLLLPSKNITDSTQNALKIMQYHYGKNVTNLMETNDNFRFEFIARKFLYQRVLSHNDVFVGNVLELKESGNVILIDFEYTSYNYRAYDFATFFGVCQRTEFRESDIWNAKQRRQFIEYYLLQFEQFKKQKYTETEWSCLLKHCDSVILEFCMINAYIWGIWAVNQAVFTKTSRIDLIDYAKYRLISQYNYFKGLWLQQYKTNIVCLSNAKL